MQMLVVGSVSCAAVAAGLLAPLVVQRLGVLRRSARTGRRVRSQQPSDRKRERSGELPREMRLYVQLARALGRRGRAPRHEAEFGAEKLRRQLTAAGLEGEVDPREARSLERRLPLAAAIAGGAAAIPVGPAALLAGLIAGSLVGALWPRRVLRRQAARRRRACVKELPAMLDILAMGVGAGLAFDLAFEVYVKRVSGVLADESRRALSLWKTGVVSRRDALLQMAERTATPEVRRFSDLVVQAIELGAPLAKVLADLAGEMRKKHRADAEERIAKAPVKMLVPTGVLILPAMLIVVMGPVLLELMSEMG